MSSPQLPFGGTQQRRLAEVNKARLIAGINGFNQRRLRQSWAKAAANPTDAAIAAHHQLVETLGGCIDVEATRID